MNNTTMSRLLHGQIGPLARVVLPPGADAAALPVLLARALRAVGDGTMAVVLPAYLLALGHGTLEVGLVSTATLLGSALATIAVGTWAHRLRTPRLLQVAALLMAATGLGFAGFSSFWPLLVVAFVGTLNPSAATSACSCRSSMRGWPTRRAAARARSSTRATALLGALAAAFGALAAAVPEWLARRWGVSTLDALRTMFLLYAVIGVAVGWLYRDLQPIAAEGDAAPRPALGPSRPIVLRLATLFSVDAFAGGLVVQALLALWLLERFGLSMGQAGVFFFWTGLLSAASQLAAPVVARRIGLLNTMVFTHIPANLCLVLAALAPNLPLALALLLVRSALSQMDVPTRTAYVMAVVTPGERAAAAGYTAVPRSLAAAVSPSLAGAAFAAGWLALPLVGCGVLKIAYDLTLWRLFRTHRVDDA
jgi:MFS family permease